MKKVQYEAYYSGRESEAISFRDTIAECMEDIKAHAEKNPRKKGEYEIFTGWEHETIKGLFCTDGRGTMHVSKHGKNIEPMF